MAEDDSWRNVIQRASGTIAGGLRAKLVTWANGFSSVTYNEWTEAIESGLQICSTKMAAMRNVLHTMGEDQLTAVVVSRLEGLGFDASMDVGVNGHCDVVVRLNDFEWLGEAKLDDSASHILGGYSQLTTRYAVGLVGQNRGGMLIYCTNESMNATMKMWEAAMPHSNISVVNPWSSANLLSLISESVVEATGTAFRVVHVPFPLLHEPKDAEIKISPAASLAARRAKAASKLAGK